MKTLFSTFIGLVLLLSTITAHSATYYFHNDHLGTPQVVTDESQAVVWQGDYDPFGKATETVATIEQNLRFPGQYLDRESGLHYNYFRTYDPSIGRYTQSDPIGALRLYDLIGFEFVVAKQTSEVWFKSLNHAYNYADQSPLNYADQWGLECNKTFRDACFGLFCVLASFSSPPALGSFGAGQAGRPAPIELHQIGQINRPRRSTGGQPNR